MTALPHEWYCIESRVECLGIHTFLQEKFNNVKRKTLEWEVKWRYPLTFISAFQENFLPVLFYWREKTLAFIVTAISFSKPQLSSFYHNNGPELLFATRWYSRFSIYVGSSNILDVRMYVESWSEVFSCMSRIWCMLVNFVNDVVVVREMFYKKK